MWRRATRRRRAHSADCASARATLSTATRSTRRCAAARLACSTCRARSRTAGSTTRRRWAATSRKDGRLLLLSRIDDNPVFFGGGIGGRITEIRLGRTAHLGVRALDREPDSPPRPRAAAERQRARDRVESSQRCGGHRARPRSARGGGARAVAGLGGRDPAHAAFGRQDRLGVARDRSPGAGLRPRQGEMGRRRRSTRVHRHQR